MGWSGSQRCRTPHRLRKARLCYRRWSYDKLCEPAEVLRGCRQCELELGTAWPAQTQATQPEDPLEMCKQHLNSFAIAARAIECLGLGQRPGYVTGLLVDAAWDSAQRRLRTGDKPITLAPLPYGSIPA